MPNDRVRRPDTSLEWHDPQESSRRPAPNRPVVAQQAGPLSYLQQSYATPGSIRRPATVAPISQQPIRTAQWQDPFPSAGDAPQPSRASVPGQTLSSDSTARDPSGAGAPLYDPGQSAPGQRGRMATSERDPVRASAFSPKPPRASILAEHAEYIDQSSARASQTEHNPSQPSAARPGSSVSAPPPPRHTSEQRHRRPLARGQSKMVGGLHRLERQEDEHHIFRFTIRQCRGSPAGRGRGCSGAPREDSYGGAAPPRRASEQRHRRPLARGQSKMAGGLHRLERQEDDPHIFGFTIRQCRGSPAGRGRGCSGAPRGDQPSRIGGNGTVDLA